MTVKQYLDSETQSLNRDMRDGIDYVMNMLFKEYIESEVPKKN